MSTAEIRIDIGAKIELETAGPAVLELTLIEIGDTNGEERELALIHAGNQI